MNAGIYQTLADIAGLSVFADLKKHPLLEAFENLLLAFGAGTVTPRTAPDLELIRRWAAFTGVFIAASAEVETAATTATATAAEAGADAAGSTETGGAFYSVIASLTLRADNPFTRAAEAGGDNLPPVLRAAAQADLRRLGRIAGFDIPGLSRAAAEILRAAGLAGEAQNIESQGRAFAAPAASAPGIFRETGWALPEAAAFIHARGAGEMGRYHSFRWINSPERPFRPVPHPDPVGLGDLSGYEEQRSVICSNTLRFIEGKPANNLLLYGDRGTGKSATVKAVCNEYARRGLKLLEVRKSDLPELPRILELLASRALRFILFIDDLSFEKTDDSFTCLKALLEGGAGVRPPNVAVYATSNRRHLVRERFSDRPAEAGSDVRAFDTMQEQFSLADRFGLTVIFTSPSQEEYLRIAEFIARRRGLLPPAAASPAEAADEADAEGARGLFRENALRWERWFNGRSPRTAAQYVDWIAGGEGFPWD
jgi:predicted AAA+ superfamily ATPase